MNLNHLYYFKTLARLEHYTKAAEELNITQPSLSHAIASLEEELSTSLFERQGRNVVLTKYGRQFLRYVEASLELLDDGIKKTKEMTGDSSGIIDLGFIYTLGSHYVPQLVNNFLNTYQDKNIKFSFSQGNTKDIIKGLKEEKYDVALCSFLADEKDIEFIPITKEELVVIVPKDHPLAAKDSVDLLETIPYPQVYFNKSSGLRPVIDQLFQSIKELPNIVYELEEDSSVAGLVAGNFGIAILPDIPLLAHMDVKKLTINTPKYERYIYMAQMKKRYQTPITKAFIQYIIEEQANKL